MTTGSILLGIALLLVVALFVARPLLVPAGRKEGRLSRRQALLAQKEALLLEIRDLDFDLETGKVPAEDHAQRRQQLVLEAASILQQLDALGTADRRPPTADRQGMEAEIEAAVARQRRRTTSQRAPATQSAFSTQHSALSTEKAAVGRRPSAVAAPADGLNFCPGCGRQAQPEDMFCAGCGRQLRERQI